MWGFDNTHMLFDVCSAFSSCAILSSFLFILLHSIAVRETVAAIFSDHSNLGNRKGLWSVVRQNSEWRGQVNLLSFNSLVLILLYRLGKLLTNELIVYSSFFYLIA